MRDRKCEHCGHGRAVFTPVISALPRVMLVHLKRFQGIKQVDYAGNVQFRYLKVAKEVGIDPVLDLTQLTSPAVRAPPQEHTGPCAIRCLAQSALPMDASATKLRKAAGGEPEPEPAPRRPPQQSGWSNSRYPMGSLAATSR